LDGVRIGGLPGHAARRPALIPFTSASVACAWGKFQLDVFARASDGKLYAATWSGGGPIAPSKV